MELFELYQDALKERVKNNILMDGIEQRLCNMASNNIRYRYDRVKLFDKGKEFYLKQVNCQLFTRTKTFAYEVPKIYVFIYFVSTENDIDFKEFNFKLDLEEVLKDTFDLNLK